MICWRVSKSGQDDPNDSLVLDPEDAAAVAGRRRAADRPACQPRGRPGCATSLTALGDALALALLHAVPLRPQDRRVGDGEGAGLPHHRLVVVRLALLLPVDRDVAAAQLLACALGGSGVDGDVEGI